MSNGPFAQTGVLGPGHYALDASVLSDTINLGAASSFEASLRLVESEPVS